MSGIFLPVPWISKPPFGQASLDPSKSKNIAGYWLSNEGVGKKIYDLSGNNITGTLGDGVSWIHDTERGRVLAFNGAETAVVALGNNPSIDITGDRLYLAAYVKINTAGDNYFISKGQPWHSSSGYALYQYLDGLIYFDVYIGGAIRQASSAAGITDNKWHYVEGLYDGNNVYVKVDGISGAPVAASGNITSASQHLEIGKFYLNGSRNIDGLIDIPIVSASPIKANYIDYLNPLQDYIPIAAPTGAQTLTQADIDAIVAGVIASPFFTTMRTRVDELWQTEGHDPDNPLVNDDDSDRRYVGPSGSPLIDQSVVTVGNKTTVTRIN